MSRAEWRFAPFFGVGSRVISRDQCCETVLIPKFSLCSTASASFILTQVYLTPVQSCQRVFSRRGACALLSLRNERRTRPVRQHSPFLSAYMHCSGQRSTEHLCSSTYIGASTRSMRWIRHTVFKRASCPVPSPDTAVTGLINQELGLTTDVQEYCYISVCALGLEHG